MTETPINGGRVLRAFETTLGFQRTLSLLIALERAGLRRARIPSARTLRLSVLHRLPRRADRDLTAAQLGVSRAVVDYHWRKRHGHPRR